MQFPYNDIPVSSRKPMLGLIVLQSDETIENELRQWLPVSDFDLLVSRVPSGEEVTEETLGEMAEHLTQSAGLFPRSANFSVVGYGCTSGTSVIGANKVEDLVKQGCKTNFVTNPMSALIKACQRRNILRLAFLSPYLESVSEHLRSVLAEHGIQCPVFGTFNEAEEAKVAWIDAVFIKAAAKHLIRQEEVDGVFLSCTNLKTLGFVESLSAELQLPVLSSNFVLAEEMRLLSKT